MEKLSMAIDIAMLISAIILPSIIFYLIKEVQQYRDEVEYLKSTLEQAVEVSTKAEDEAKEAKKLIRYHIDHHYKIAQKSFFQGKAMGRKENDDDKKTNYR